MTHHDGLEEASLEAAAQRLGARAAERLDVEATAHAVVERLRAAPRRSAVAWALSRPAWLKVAAVLVVLAGGALALRGRHEPAATRTAVLLPVTEDLGDFTADQLRETARSLEQPLGDESAGVPDSGLDGLSADELRALLRTLEG